mmetsp:Transcript_28501/g.81630  ORF Transcript_28501/g.81630 Transcript_28501/m.81630 type:complete len:276 (+) Transcript_28501:86-913(+)
MAYAPGQPVQGAPVQGAFAQQVQRPPLAYSSDEESSSASSMDGKTPISQVPPEVRSGFISKVYTLLSIQLAVTFGIALYMNTQLSRQWILSHMTVYYVSAYGTLGLVLVVSCCCRKALRTFPVNYCYLAVLTIGISVMTGFVSSLYTTESVLLALATTSGVFLMLTAYACITKSDFTGLGPYLAAGLMALMVLGLVISLFSFFTHTPVAGSPMQKVYAGLGVLLFTFYIIYDTQMVVGGKKHEISVDDYVEATIELYLDVINMFMFLLELMGSRD